MTDAERTVLRWRIGSLVFIKLATSVVTLFYFPSWHALLIVMLLSVPWFLLGGYWTARSLINYRQRRQVLQLRDRLIFEEWHVDGEQPDKLPDNLFRRPFSN